MRASHPSEAEILARIQLALGGRPDVRVFRMNVGLARDPRTGQTIRFGVPGMADLLCLVRLPDPLPSAFLWLEVKSVVGRLRPEQEAFQRMVQERFGSLHYAVARSVEAAEAAVERLQRSSYRGRG